MSERLSDAQVGEWVADRWYNPLAQANEPTVAALLAQEVQESRRLIADLLAMRCPRHDPSYREGYVDALSEVRQRIEQASP